MKRFFTQEIGNPHILTGDEHKHLSVVLRAKVGDEVVLCCGDGYDCICEIAELSRNETVLIPVRKVKNESEPSVAVTLFSAIMKGDKNDLVVQKAVELGAIEVRPLVTEYVQSHSVRTDRLNKIALEAAKQCGRSTLTRVCEPITLQRFASIAGDFDLTVFPYEKADKPSLKEFLRGADVASIKKVAVIIGSEGGFSESEVNLLCSAGITPVTLGKRILRAETANIAVLSAVMYELGQWQ